MKDLLLDADSAIRFLNSHAARGALRVVEEKDERGWTFTDWRVHPFDSLDLQFGEGYIHGKRRFVGCPSTPDYYAIQNRRKLTRFSGCQYGRAVRLFAALVARRDAEQSSGQSAAPHSL